MKLPWRALGLCLLLVGCTAPVLVPTPTTETPSGPVQPLRLAGPENLEPLLRALAAAYQREVPSVEVSVLKRADPLAWEALQNAEVDLIGLAWVPEQLPPETWVQPLARDGLAVVVNAQNGIPGKPLLEWKLPAGWNSGVGWRTPQKSLGKPTVQLPAGRHKLIVSVEEISIPSTFFCKLVFSPVPPAGG